MNLGTLKDRAEGKSKSYENFNKCEKIINLKGRGEK